MSEMNQKLPQTQSYAEDEINLLEYIYVLVKHKWIIIAMAILGFAVGHIAAMIKGPVYVADANISQSVSQESSSPNLSGFGLLGGVVASQLNIGGDASLDKISFLLSSRSFHESVVREKKLKRFAYPDFWDTLSNDWVDNFTPPEDLYAGAYINAKFVDSRINENGTMTIVVEHQDSISAYDILNSYIEYLDYHIRESVKVDALENRLYLEKQLYAVEDPLLRLKIQELIASEVEKGMVVSKRAFKIVDDILIYRTFKEKRTYPIIFTLCSFFCAIIFVIIFDITNKVLKSKRNSGLVAKILRELLKIPFTRLAGRE